MPNLKRPLLKYEIVEAQENSRSAAEAARYLGVNWKTYKKYAQFYGIYENLLNKSGIGTDKGFAKTQKHSTKLRDIFNNEYPDYPLQRLRWRMVARGLIDDCCEICGMDEGRITDKKKPLLLVYRNEENNFRPNNLQMICYNCVFLTKDAPSVVTRSAIERTVKNPNVKATYVDKWKNPDRIGLEPDEDLTDEDIAQLKREIDEELGRT